MQDKATSESGTPVSLLNHAEAPYNRRYRALVTGIFVQDDWKISPRFTLNAGVRYDSMANFFSILSPQLTNFVLGNGGFDQSISTGVTGLQPSTHVLNHSVWQVTPRVGFSYDVFGDGRTALRGGFGVFADQPPYIHITDITAGQSSELLHAQHQRVPGATYACLPVVQRADWLHRSLSCGGHE